MRPVLLFIVCLIASLPLNLLGQSYPAFKLDTDQPQAGKPIHFVYTGMAGKTIDPRLTMYFEVDGAMKWQTLKTRFNGAATEGTLTIPDGVAAICIKAKSTHDTLEAFVFNVYKNGKRVRGSLWAAAKFYNLYNIYTGLRDPQKALALVNEELAQDPALKQQDLLGYYRLVLSPFYKDATIDHQVRETWRDSLSAGHSEQFLAKLSAIWNRGMPVDTMMHRNRQIIAKYPHGETAFRDAVYQTISKERRPNVIPDLSAVEKEYPKMAAAGLLDGNYSGYAHREFEVGNVAGGSNYLSKIRDERTRGAAYHNAANVLLRKDLELNVAKEYIQKAIELLKYEVPPAYMDSDAWQRTSNAMQAGHKQTLAEILYKTGDVAKAIKLLEEIIPLADQNSALKEKYLEYLLKSGNAKQAFDKAGEYVRTGRSSAGIVKLLKEAYVKNNGSPSGYDQLYRSLIAQLDKNYKLPDYGHLNVPNIDFTLKNAEGQQVTLSSFKGRPVVLFFFTMSYRTPEHDSILSRFNKIAANSTVANAPVFLAIDKTSVSQDDEANGMPLRMAKIKTFLAQKQLDLNVLMDNFYRHPSNTAYSYYRVADLYSATDGCQLYVIDKKGLVKYKSFPTNLTTGDSFNRELLAALKLVE